MQTIIIFIIESIVPVAVLLLAAICIHTLATRRSRPRYRPEQLVLGQNYKTANGEYVKCRIARVYTEWLDAGKYEHRYICVVEDKKNITLELREDRVKKWEI